LSLFAASAFAHVCVMNPPQRGGFNVAGPGDNSCYERQPLCVDRAVGLRTNVQSGGQLEVQFQQNLNHYWQDEPGVFQVELLAGPLGVVELDIFDDFPAHEMVTQTNYTRVYSIPAVKQVTNATLQVKYVSNNPGEVDPPTNKRAVFYQCSDIVLLPVADQATQVVEEEEAQLQRADLARVSSRSRPAPLGWHESGSDDAARVEESFTARLRARKAAGSAARAAAVAAGAASSSSSPELCSLPEEYSFSGTQLNLGSWGTTRVEYVTVARSGQFALYTRGSQVLITNYTSGYEYVIDTETKACSLYGPDPAYDWIFTMDQYVGFTPEGYYTFADPEHLYSWVVKAKASVCSLVSFSTPSQSTIVYDFAPSVANPKIFEPTWYTNNCKTPLVRHKTCGPL
jgi:hypothetical protein